MFVRYSLAVSPTLHPIRFFFSHITDLCCWRDAEKHTHGLACLTSSLVDYFLDCATIEHVTMPRAVDQNSRVTILSIIANHQITFSGILRTVYNRHSAVPSVRDNTSALSQRTRSSCDSHFSPTLSLVHVAIFWLARHQKMATRAVTVDIFVWKPLTTTENVSHLNSDYH